MRYIHAVLSLVTVVAFLTGCSKPSDSASAESVVDHIAESPAPRIECKRVERMDLAPVVHCTGQIKPLFGTEYVVSARLAGRLLRVNVSPGEHVKRGQILGYVDSQQISEIEAEAARAASRVAIAKAHEERELRVYQEELLRPKALIVAKTAHQQARVSLKAAERNYKRLQSLFKEGIAAEKDFMNAKSALEKATLDYEQAKVEEKREQQLYDDKALIKKNWQLAHAETQSCANELQTIKERLKFLGVNSDKIGDSLNVKRLEPLMPIAATGEGIVVQQFVSAGEMVGPEESIFSICNMKSVAISCELPESELALISKSLPVEVTLNTYGDRKFVGKVEYVGSRLDPKTRTIPVRAVIDNQNGLLKLNMFASVNIAGKPKSVIACPRDALHESGGKKVVYVRTAPGEFDKRVVKTGIASGELVEISSGLRSGEDVVTEGGVLVKTKILMSERGDG